MRVSVRDVAQEAGMSPASVLYYYPDVGKLIEEAIHHTVERFAERRRTVADSLPDARERLAVTIRAGFPTGPDDEDLRVLYAAGPYFRDNPLLGALIRSMTAGQVELYRRILEVGQAQGVFDLADDSMTIARNLVALEDAYGLYIIGGAPLEHEAPALVLAYAELATRCSLAFDPAEPAGVEQPDSRA